MNLNLDPASLVAITSVFGLGASMALLGGIKIWLTEKLGIDDAQMGRLFSVWSFTNLIFVLFAGVLCDLLGFKMVAIAGFAIGAVAVFLFGQVNKYATAIIACVLLGIGGMLMNTGNVLLGNENILFKDPGQSSNLGNVFFGVGAFITPILVAWLLRSMKNLIVMALIIAAPIALALFAQLPEASGQAFDFGAAAALLTQKHVIFIALGLMCYIALEVSMGGWISTYATSLGASAPAANGILSGFWIAMMAGRLTTAFAIGAAMNLGADGAWLILVVAIAATVIAFLMSTVKGLKMGVVLIILLGLCFAPIFPTFVGLLFARTEPAIAGTAFGFVFAVGLVGAIFLPAWMGAIAKGKDIRASMQVAAGTAAVLVVIALLSALMLGEPLGT